MKTISIINIFIFIVYSMSGQITSKCDDVLSKKIILENDGFEIQDNIDSQIFNNCYLDAIDIEILYNGFLIPLIIIEATNTDEGITYGTLLEHLSEFKESEDYTEFKKSIALNKWLSEKKVGLENWDVVKQKLVELEIDSKDIEIIENHISNTNYSSYSYADLIFEMLLFPPVENGNFHPPISSKKEIEYSFESKAINFDKLMVQSKEEGKHLLIFFSGFACLNAIKMEEHVLSDPSIKRIIENEFIYQKLYVDDNSKLEGDWVTKDKKAPATIGAYNSNFQITKFQNNMQPYFVIMDDNKNLIAQIGYVQLEEFIEFLEKGQMKK